MGPISWDPLGPQRGQALVGAGRLDGLDQLYTSHVFCRTVWAPIYWPRNECRRAADVTRGGATMPTVRGGSDTATRRETSRRGPTRKTRPRGRGARWRRASTGPVRPGARAGGPLGAQAP